MLSNRINQYYVPRLWGKGKKRVHFGVHFSKKGKDQIPVLPPYLVTFAVQLLVINLRKAVVDVGRRMVFLPNMEMISVLLV